jgi:hypothetical protein
MDIEEAPEFTGYVLAVPGPDGQTRLINVTQEEYLRHRELLPCAPKAAQVRVINKWPVFD